MANASKNLGVWDKAPRSSRERTEETWVEASDLAEDLDKQIKEVRKAGGPGTEKKVDGLYRDKYDLKQLGDTQVKAQRTKNGGLEIADRKEVKRQVKELQRGKQQERGRER